MAPGNRQFGPTPSPCIGICRLDPATDWCVGCSRTGGEIAEWMTASEKRRRQIVASTELRRTRESRP
jgi:predicted Fe-S protein YdhL (DUF1289 family)